MFDFSRFEGISYSEDPGLVWNLSTAMIESTVSTGIVQQNP